MLEVRVGAGAYVCGEETSLLESLEGRRGLVRFKPPLPAIKGLFGKPTVINNVISLASVPIILAKGGSFYKDFGMGRCRGTLPIQLAGNLKQTHSQFKNQKTYDVELRTIDSYGITDVRFIKVDVEGSDGQRHEALTYMKTALREPRTPSEEYKQRLIMGALAHGLPLAYVARLRAFDAHPAAYPVPRGLRTIQVVAASGDDCHCSF